MTTAHTPESRTGDVLERHYRRLADRYDDFLYYSPAFVRTLTTRMIGCLQLDAHHRFVDLGCGTGMYTLDILQQVPLRSPAVCVDPFPEMLARIPPEAPVVTRAAGALAFSAGEGTWDRILMKEAVHHIDDRPALFSNLFARLSSGGRLLLVHVPPRVAYPLFDAALRRAESWHADPDELVTQLQAAGFRVEREGLDVPHAIPTPTYFEMVARRYMSVLSSFSDEEIAAGLAEMEARYGARPTLEFTDHFDYITGIKPE